VNDLVLVQNLQYHGAIFNGYATSSWEGTTFQNYHGQIVYNVASPQDLHRMIHHEIFHIVDRIQTNQSPDVDPEWCALNPTGFTYLADSVIGIPEPEDPIPGFATVYAQRSPYEDKADTYGSLLSSPEIMAQRCKNDSVLRAKVDLIKRRLAAFCPEMDDEFWAYVSSRKPVL
jgi:hypothetical protein